MQIILHCGGMPFNGETIKTESLGGSETAAYYLAKELAALGHDVKLFTNHETGGKWDGVKYIYAGPVDERNPLGKVFHVVAGQVPHDVCIIQRHPFAFTNRWASKINILHLHDLALHRSKDQFMAQMWNVDAVMVVSEYHKKQVCKVYGINPDIVFPITNGVDLALFEGGVKDALFGKWFGTLKNPKDATSYMPKFNKQIKLLYSSRPERGLENLVRAGGIMEKLYEKDKNIHLYVCAYKNITPQKKGYYDALSQRCKALPNVTELGALTKKQLADTMRQCDLLVYPTNFEEVSCITAMEAMAAGLPMISSEVAALPETCAETAGTELISLLEDGGADVDKFVERIPVMIDYKSVVEQLVVDQLEAAKKYTWENSALKVNRIIDTCFDKYSNDHLAKLKHFEKYSDIMAISHYFDEQEISGIQAEEEIQNFGNRISELYDFAFSNKFAEHYAAYYQYEKNRGVNYGPENLDGNGRFETVCKHVENSPKDAVWLDYGCAHGHYTINLAKRFPDKHFIGIDIAASNIEKARKWADDDKVKNAKFYRDEYNKELNIVKVLNGFSGAGGQLPDHLKFDGIIAAEVIEHITEPEKYIDGLCRYLKDGGLFVMTTPFGPWEAIGYEEHYPWRAHLHHFDRTDLKEMCGHHPEYGVSCAMNGFDNNGDTIGSYVTAFYKPAEPTRLIDYDRKFRECVPKQSIALCMIVRDGESTLRRSLESTRGVIDEYSFAVDETTTDRTWEIIDDFLQDEAKHGRFITVHKQTIKSPLEIGFDAARNKSKEPVSSEWILWMDADEIITGKENIGFHLKANAFSAYGVQQHHYSVQPLGLIKTDWPTRLIRNLPDMKFYGIVHEHPELKINDGPGHAMLLAPFCINHDGYDTEKTRRERFQRNIGLMVRDRETYPDRVLGKFLWVRDLSLMNRWELEQNGSIITPDIQARAMEAMEIWEELLKLKNSRMIVDSLEFYNEISQVLGNSFEFAFKLDASKLNGGINIDAHKPIVSHFHKVEHVKIITALLIKERIDNYESKYF